MILSRILEAAAGTRYYHLNSMRVIQCQTLTIKVIFSEDSDADAAAVDYQKVVVRAQSGATSTERGLPASGEGGNA